MIADRIKYLRIRSGMTQAGLAEQLHITRSNVNAWEHGHAVPSTGMLIALTKLFGVSADYLLGISEETEFINIALLRSEEKQILLSMYQCFQKLYQEKEQESNK